MAIRKNEIDDANLGKKKLLAHWEFPLSKRTVPAVRLTITDNGIDLGSVHISVQNLLALAGQVESDLKLSK